MSLLNRPSMMWAFQAVYTQTTSTGSVDFRMTANERMTFLWGQTGLDDYASGRTITARMADADNKFIARLATLSIDNQNMPFPASDLSVLGVGDGPFFEKKIEMAAGDYLRIDAASLLATEKLTIALRGLIRTTKPTIAITTTAGTIPGTVSSNKVI